MLSWVLLGCQAVRLEDWGADGGQACCRPVATGGCTQQTRAVQCCRRRFCWPEPHAGRRLHALPAALPLQRAQPLLPCPCRYARWIHKDMWHDNPVGWILHKSHHEPRVGPFEANDLCECKRLLRLRVGWGIGHLPQAVAPPGAPAGCRAPHASLLS